MPGHNKFEGIISKITTLDQFQSVVLRIDRHDQEIGVGEVNFIGSAFFVAAMMRQIQESFVWVVADRKQQEALSIMFKSLGQEVRNIDDMQLNKKRGGIVVVTVEQALTQVEDLRLYLARGLSLDVGGQDGLNLSGALVRAGYERVRNMTEPGQFTVKGDVIEIATVNGTVKISLLGSAIESINIAQEGKKEKSRSIYIPPVGISPGASLLLTYFTGSVFVFQNKDYINGQIIKSVQSFKDELSSDNLKQLAQLQNFLSSEVKIYLESFTVDEKNGVSLSWFAPKNYSRNTQDLIRDLKSAKEQRKKVIISARAPDRFEKLLAHNHLSFGEGEYDIALVQSDLPEGVVMPQLGVTILTEKEIIGEVNPASLKPRRTRGLDFSAITNLKVGEFVVHIDHGIGRFTGFGTVLVDGVTREYIFIEYSGQDKIYCPLDQADKITKYISVGNTEPKLSHLASGQWEKIRLKVKEDVERVARELLEVQAMREKTKQFAYLDDTREQQILAETFGHTITPDQERAISEILANMKDTKPMDRLLCGDVGYGKTEVALRAALRAVVSGGQVAFLVPTTILAEQHVQTLESRLGQFGVRIASLSRFVNVSDQKKALQKLKTGQLDIIVGTHRLLSSDMEFKNLMLVVIDEEQKFGVKHKEKLKKMRSGVDILTMTATPIPRTLYLGLSGLKEISLIQTPPEGRLPIKTLVVKKSDEVIVEAIQKELARGGQLYIVHNRVETIEAFAAYLHQLVPELTYRVAHGQMGEGVLAQIINDFAAGEFKALICSTIIESGLDISTVNTMIVDRATNFGLSQLHQLRGRIGRGSVQAYAYFLYSEQELVGDAQKRLASIIAKGDLGSGYELSLEDLDIRGSGNILGKQQHGSMQMVGVGYYMKLLEEAVTRLQNESSDEEKEKDIKIDLPISAYIPDGFYKTEEQKIKAYQILAGVETEDELYDFRSKEEESATSLPEEYDNLLLVAKLKILAKQVGVVGINTQDVPVIDLYKKKRLVMVFDHDLSNAEKAELLSVSPSWLIKSREAKIDLSALGDKWFNALMTVLEFLAH